jgi:hypothetical protein
MPITDGVCLESFNTAGKYVSVNGVVRHSNVFFETFATGASLRIVNLGITSTNADSYVIKVSLMASPHEHLLPIDWLGWPFGRSVDSVDIRIELSQQMTSV